MRRRRTGRAWRDPDGIAIGSAGVVATHQVVAAAVLLPIDRPSLRWMTWPQWWPVLLLALVFSCLNPSLCT